jgi:hypothetical protein
VLRSARQTHVGLAATVNAATGIATTTPHPTTIINNTTYITTKQQQLNSCQGLRILRLP